jgi:hypothetical protein
MSNERPRTDSREDVLAFAEKSDGIFKLPEEFIDRVAEQIAHDLRKEVREGILKTFPDAWTKGLVVRSTELMGYKVLKSGSPSRPRSQCYWSI